MTTTIFNHEIEIEFYELKFPCLSVGMNDVRL